MQPVLLPPETEGIFLVKLPQIAETERISYLAAGTKFQDSQPPARSMSLQTERATKSS